MFVGDEVRAEISATAAAARLANLISGSSLIHASHEAWGDGIARVGPLPVLSKLVRVQFLEPVQRGTVTVLTLRWEATGAAGRIFPVLDADIILAPDGEDGTRLGLDGVYRPPGGAVGAGLDRVILHRIATATVHSLLTRIADAITSPAPAADRIELAVSSDTAAERLASESP
jgi:hypothetical protein